MDIKKLIRKNILALSPYSTARDEFEGKIGTFLDANESPYENGYNRYPDPRQMRLKDVIGNLKGVSTDKIFIGNGSDEAIDLMFRIFCNPGRDNAIAIAPSYGMYEVAAAINDVEMRQVKLNPDFSLPVEALLDSADENSKLVFICSPNNPTGNAFEKERIIEVVENFKGIVIVDEAYIDFSNKPGMLKELTQYENLVVLQTLSKAWGMAGLRCGLAFASKEIIGYMNEVKYPYNINVATIEKVLALLQKPVDNKIAEIKQERIKVIDGLKKIDSIKYIYPTDANFVLVKVEDADLVYNYLTSRGIIVRNRNKVVMCDNCLRITIGTPDENRRLIESLKNYK